MALRWQPIALSFPVPAEIGKRPKLNRPGRHAVIFRRLSTREKSGSSRDAVRPQAMSGIRPIASAGPRLQMLLGRNAKAMKFRFSVEKSG